MAWSKDDYLEDLNSYINDQKAEWHKADEEGRSEDAARIAAETEARRDEARDRGYTEHDFYTIDDDRDDIFNYSAEELRSGTSDSRPPAWLDWDDDGLIDDEREDGKYDASGNRLDAVDENGYRVGDWRVNPDDWYDSGGDGMEKVPTYLVGGGETITNDEPQEDYYDYSEPPYTPYIPPAPSFSAAVPQAPADPGAQPAFTKKTQKELVRYEYMYGIKDLRIRGNEYADRSIYVSKPIQVDGNVMQVSLSAVEEHPLFNSISGEATERQTSIEYYIAYKENPALEDWYPVLPEGQQTIPSELLIFDTARTANLRFPALVTETSKVFRNGIQYNNWAFVSGGTRVQLLEEQIPGSVYTISYTPNAEIDDPWTIDIYQRGVSTAKQVDVFPSGANHNKTLVLSKYPYVNYEYINGVPAFNPNTTGYRPVSVSLRNGNISALNKKISKEVGQYTGSTVDAAFLNITDYKTKEWKTPQAYSLDKTAPYTMFEYSHEGKKLVFSEAFNKADILSNQDITHGNGELVVEYDYLVSHFRVKIILRRTGAGINSVSPIVHEYVLKFKVMK